MSERLKISPQLSELLNRDVGDGQLFTQWPQEIVRLKQPFQRSSFHSQRDLAGEAKYLVGYYQRHLLSQVALSGRATLVLNQAGLVAPVYEEPIIGIPLPSAQKLKDGAKAAIITGALIFTANRVHDIYEANHTAVQTLPITTLNPNFKHITTQPSDAGPIAQPTEEPTLTADSTDQQAKEAWEKWRKASVNHVLFYGSDSIKPIDPPFEDPKHPSSIIDSVTRLAIENDLNPGIVLTLVDILRKQDDTNGFYYKTDNRPVERRGLGLLTKEEFDKGIALKIEEDQVLDKGQSDPSWYTWGDQTIDEKTNIYGLDDIYALIYLLKNGESFTSFRESAKILHEYLHQEYRSGRVNLDFGFRAVYDLEIKEGRDADLLYATLTVLDAQAKEAAQPVRTTLKITARETAQPVSDTQITQLLQKYFGPLGVDVKTLSAIIDKESKFNPKAENGPYKGLFQIDGVLHQDFIKKLYGYYDPNMLIDPEINTHVASELYKDAKRRTGNGLKPWGIIGSLITLDKMRAWKRRNKEVLQRTPVIEIPEPTLAPFGLHRLDESGLMRVKVLPKYASLEEAKEFYETQRRVTREIAADIRRVEEWVRVKKDWARKLGGQVVSNRKIDEVIHELAAKWRNDIMPSDMRKVVLLATSLIENEYHRNELRGYYLYEKPDDRGMKRINKLLSAVAEKEVIERILENYKTPEERMQVRKQTRKEAMKVMLSRAKKLFKRKITWDKLTKDQMLEVSLSLAEDGSLDWFTDLISEGELKTSNRTNRRLNDTLKRHAEFLKLVDEETLTKTSLLMKEMLKTQSRSKAAKKSFANKKAQLHLHAVEDMETSEHVDKFLKTIGRVRIGDEELDELLSERKIPQEVPQRI